MRIIYLYKSSMLSSKFYCTVEDETNVNVVAELISSEKGEPFKHTFVIAIDISGSMDCILRGDSRTLLDRMKIFAKLFIKSAPPSTFFALVTFAAEAQVLFPMSQLTEEAKTVAIECIDELTTEDGTNLGAGILTSLAEICKYRRKTRDCIILFTDGEANEGYENVNDIVFEYENAMKRRERKNKVSLSAITIAGYRPTLLLGVSESLGSEAFYWLDVESDFEADMHLPLFISEETCICDIRMEVIAQKEIVLISDLESNQFLKRKSDKKLEYFFHLLPKMMTKNVSFTAKISKDVKKGESMFELHINYFDGQMNQQTMAERIIFENTPVLSVRKEKLNVQNNKYASYMKRTSAYIIENNRTKKSWKNAQVALAKNLEQSCRNKTISGIKQACEIDIDEYRDLPIFEDTIKELLTIKEKSEYLLKGSEFTNFLDNIDGFITQLNHASMIIGSENCGKLMSMASSIATEMPTASNVFSPEREQPYISENISRKLRSYRNFIYEFPRDPKAPLPAIPHFAQPDKVEEEAEPEPSHGNNVPLPAAAFVKKKPVKLLVGKETKKAFRPPKPPQDEINKKIFLDKKFILSDDLMLSRNKQNQSYLQLLHKCGAQAASNINPSYKNMILVATKKEVSLNSQKVKEAKRLKIPIVSETFIDDCILAGECLDFDTYNMASSV